MQLFSFILLLLIFSFKHLISKMISFFFLHERLLCSSKTQMTIATRYGYLLDLVSEGSEILHLHFIVNYKTRVTFKTNTCKDTNLSNQKYIRHPFPWWLRMRFVDYRFFKEILFLHYGYSLYVFIVWEFISEIIEVKLLPSRGLIRG